jgi:dienelactone hydrolase
MAEINNFFRRSLNKCIFYLFNPLLPTGFDFLKTIAEPASLELLNLFCLTSPKTKYMTTRFLLALVFVSTFFFVSCNNSETSANQEKDSTATSSQLKEDNITYSSDNTTMNGYVVYEDSMRGKRPAVLVVHEWWGMNNYTKMRARQLAQLGYVAMAVDMYGDGKTASNPEEAGKLAGAFYQNPQLTKARFDAALTKLKSYPQVDTNNIAAIGYCYGGFVVLTNALLGDPLKGVVAFHGGMPGINPDKNLLKAKILALHGEADSLVKPQAVQHFKHQMDSIGADCTVKMYPNAKHAFTNPASDSVENKFHIGVGYNEVADKQSWNAMKEFFQKLFGK